MRIHRPRAVTPTYRDTSCDELAGEPRARPSLQRCKHSGPLQPWRSWRELVVHGVAVLLYVVPFSSDDPAGFAEGVCCGGVPIRR